MRQRLGEDNAEGNGGVEEDSESYQGQPQAEPHDGQCHQCSHGGGEWLPNQAKKKERQGPASWTDPSEPKRERARGGRCWRSQCPWREVRARKELLESACVSNQSGVGNEIWTRVRSGEAFLCVQGLHEATPPNRRVGMIVGLK